MGWWNGKDELDAFYRLPALERIAIMALGHGAGDHRRDGDEVVVVPRRRQPDRRLPDPRGHLSCAQDRRRQDMHRSVRSDGGGHRTHVGQEDKIVEGPHNRRDRGDAGMPGMGTAPAMARGPRPKAVP